jgi:perosamine synthetase
MDERRSNLAYYGGTPAVTCKPIWPPVDASIEQALLAAYRDGSWGKYHGAFCERLAGRLTECHAVDHAWLCSSGTIAVELALRGLRVGADDEVILAAYDFGGNFRAIDAVGGRPVLVDIDAESWCLDPRQLEGVSGERVRAVIVSHLHGGIADMPAICRIAGQRGWFVVEDACQATGATVHGRLAGTWGDVGVLSFGGSKLLTAGRGGAVLTRDAAILQRIRILCTQGNNPYPLSELQATVVLPQLDRLDEQNSIRLEHARRLLRRTAEIRGLKPVQFSHAESTPAFYKLAWLYDSTQFGNCTVDEFVAMAQAERIPVDRGFKGFAHRSSKRCHKFGNLPHSVRAAESTIVLHHPILLCDATAIDQVAEGLLKLHAALASH